MAVSPSAQKVDDFLLKISAISQQRLRESQKTQRELNLLRTNDSGAHGPRPDLGISELHFNRSKRGQFYEEWKGKAPPTPARPGQAPEKPQKPESLASEHPPKLPARKENPPALPKRPEYVSLGVPVAREASPKRAEKAKPERPEKVKPERPEKPQIGKPAFKVLGKNQTDSFLDIEESIRNGDKPESLFKPQPVRPRKPPKFQSKESEMLQEKIRLLSPTKGKPASTTPEKKNAQLKSFPESNSSVKGLKPAPKKPLKPLALTGEHEAFLALEKLKKPAAVQPKHPSVPEAMLKLQSIKQKPSLPKAPHSDKIEQKHAGHTEKNGTTKAQLNKTTRAPDFHSQLASVLRALTEPLLSVKPPEIRRSSTEPESGKLTHPNKSRAKGPRRKLPKSASEKAPEAPRAKKVPPPKAKKPNFELKPRFDGEIFI